jgi:predicted phage terminase large subunit-like protein
MNTRKFTRADQQASAEWQAICERIKNATASLPVEDVAQKEARIERLSNNFIEFCEYYLSDFMKAPFGWFHLEAIKQIVPDPKAFAVLEWPREHAKSVFANVMLPMYLYARKELTGMIVVSANGDKAAQLLGDLQAQFVANQRWLADYGNLAAHGDWRDGHFATTDGKGFWAYGRTQSPRGARKSSNRPNLAVIDDIDDKVIVKSESRVREAVDWVLEDLFFCLSTKPGGRLIVAGNRIHKKSILAHLVGDVEESDPKRPKIKHIKVYATEDAKHRKAYPNTPGARPAWKENYSMDELTDKMSKAGHRASRREFYHEHIAEGTVFKNEWIHWGKVPKIMDLYELIAYCDPSFKNTTASDYKAWVLLGKQGRKLFIIDAWVRQASVSSMASIGHDWFEDYGTAARYYIEANMLQDLLQDEFDTESDQRDIFFPLRQDKRKKPDKTARIENMSPLFERGNFVFNEDKRKDPDMQTLVSQILAFPDGHDDGPDALEGALSLMQSATRGHRFEPRLGSFNKNTKRR